MTVYLVIIFAYFLFVTGISFLTSKISSRSSADFLLAGRNLGLLTCTVIIAGEWLGGNSTIGVSEQAFTTRSLQPILYNLATAVGMIVTGFTVAYHYRAKQVHTVSEMLEHLFGPGARVITAIPFLVAYVTLGFVQLQSIASVMSGVLSLDWTFAIVLSTAVVTIYTYVGGMHAITLVNVIHLVVKIVGIGGAFIVGMAKVGGFAALEAAVVAAGGPANPYNPFTVSLNDALGLLVGGILGGMAAQASIQPVFAARSPEIAWKAAILSSLIIAPFGIMTAMLGLIARSHPAFGLDRLSNAKIVLPALLVNPEFIHPILGGLAIAGILAAILSTIAPVSFAVVTIAVSDVYQRVVRRPIDDRTKLAVSKKLVIVVNLMLMPLALYVRGGILEMSYISYAIRSIGAIVIAAALYRRGWINLLGVKLAFVGGTAAVFLFILAKQLGWFSLDKTFGAVLAAVAFLALGKAIGMIRGEKS
ncbi:MAG: sodium:solute symporter family protein [Candidatus Methylomirabilota bacterium]